MDAERLRLALAGSGDLVYDIELASGRMVWNDLAVELFQGNSLSVCDTHKSFLELVDPDGRGEIDKSIARAKRDGEPYQCEYRLRTNLDTHVWVEDRGSVLLDDKGNAQRLVGLMRFVTERKERENRLLQLASYDDRTGHFNRARLRSQLALILEEYWNDRQSGGFVMVAIDNLAGFNSNFGFDIADKIIIEVGKRLQETMGPDDFIGRVAGNKFGVILGHCSRDALMRRVNLLRNAVRNNVIYTKAGPVSVTVSMGVVTLPFGCTSAKNALAMAEEALVAAKSNGLERVHFHEPSDKTESARRKKMAIADKIMGALDEDRVSLYYQPLIDTRTGLPGIYECLIRITDENGDVIPAGHFVPVAEELGLIRTLDRKVVDIALETLRKRPEISLAINVSGITATDPTWFEEVISEIGRHKGIASRLTVEITETVALQDIANLEKFLSSLRELGCRIAIDDFGAGYTSYRNLKFLDVDVVKIDGSFVRGIVDDHDNRFFVKALIDLAKKFGLETVAEWVEDEAEVALLREMGADYLQGFYFGKPAESPDWTPKG